MVEGQIFYEGGRSVLGAKAEDLDASNVTEEAAAVFSELKKYPYSPPVLLSLNLSETQRAVLNISTIEKVGLEDDGQLQAPSSWEKAGWYTASAKLGQNGVVVIDGHYDTDTGVPAAFWALKSVNVNDTFVLKDELGRDFSYRVVDIFFVDIQDPQRKQIFQESGKAELILITCGGVWDPAENTYNKRLVVKAELVG